MTVARFRGAVIAESDGTRVVEGNHYFPATAVDWDALLVSPSRSYCYWKGKASYFHVTNGDDVAMDSAWTYERPWPLARRIRDHVAFWGDVEVADH